MTTNHNFSLLLDEICAARSEAPALHHGDETISYRELAGLIDAWTDVLAKRRVGPADVVALWLPNSPAFVAAYFATLRLGGTVAPLGVLLRATEVGKRLALVRPSLLVATPPLAGQLKDTATDTLVTDLRGRQPPAAGRVAPVPRAGGDVAVLIFTSGTTGAAKAAEITHQGLAWNARGLIEGLALTSGDTQLAIAPFSHVLGMTGVMNATLLTGGALTLLERFDAAGALAAMQRTGVTGVAGAPSMFVALVREARTLQVVPRLRFVHGGGAPFPPETVRSTSETFGGDVRTGYGMSEVGGAVALEPVGVPGKPRSVGRPLPGSEVRIVDIETRAPLGPGHRGEVQVRSPSVMRGYRDDPEGTKAVLDGDGWLSTGDIGFFDDEGDLILVDRRKEIIIRSGYNVYPAEVEGVLLEYPGISEIAVVGVPHEEFGEEVVALIVPGDGHLDAEAIKSFAKERLAAYKYPRHIVFVDTLPKGPTGKVAKGEIDRDSLVTRIRAASAPGPSTKT